ncbi:hypothetical protein EAX61_09795 [Dokdonia sinensis]|uniref:2TM domain-containing protein n=1 Tax=Dokdonia sinensis TaxID=2479847 RepID=A0A3M0GAH5_9FLAO|nr:hypothetical protein [Dokdonia sinensis]RMB58583.1 hypothetical protein EAX61_09795 [Dokdonia sinensis]
MSSKSKNLVIRKIRRYSLVIIFFVVVVLAIYGVRLTNSTDPETLVRGHRFVGAAVVGLFFVWMPTFIYHRWKGRDLKDYMLTEENILKMKDFNDRKK